MWLRIIASSMLLFFTAHAQAHIRTDPNAFTTTFTWNGGDLNHSFELCVSSVQEPNPQGNTPIDYAVEAQGPFEVVSGADSIPVTLSWDDLVGGQAATLQPNLSTAEIFTGAARYCPGGNNARLDVYASGTDIQAVPPGTYTSQFNFTATNSGRGKSSANFTVSVDITIPNSIQVTQIDDIALGTFDGNNNIARSETLCVYQANGGQYAVTLTGSGNGGAFELISAGSRVPYAVSWNDGNGAQTATAGIPLPGMGNSRSGDPQCNGGASNNATVSVDVLATDMSAATASGTHSGVLTIMVEMQ